MHQDRWRIIGGLVFAFIALGFVSPQPAHSSACPAGSVTSSGYCWVVNMGESTATATCARVGLTGSNGFVTGLQWTPEILAEVSGQLGCFDAGDTGCCAQSMWLTTSTNTCFTDNFSANVGGADFFNWSGQRLPGQFAVDACDCPVSGECQFSGSVVSALSPAEMWIGLKTSNDIGTKFDLLAEVLKNGTVIASSQLDDVAPNGNSSFSSAKLRTIAQTLSGPVTFESGDNLEFRLSVRVAVGVNGHRSGTARLWFNDADANSGFDATIDGQSVNLYLVSGSALDTSPGAGPKQNIDVFVDRLVNGNAFIPFGTWAKTF